MIESYETVGETSKMLIERVVLSQSEIRNRLALLFPNLRECIMPVIHPISEEVEKIILEITSPMPKKGKHVIMHAIRYKSGTSTRIKEKGYCCPKCSYTRVLYGHNFCPQCGVPIEWSDTQKSKVKEGLPVRTFANIRKSKGNHYGGPNQMYSDQR